MHDGFLALASSQLGSIEKAKICRAYSFLLHVFGVVFAWDETNRPNASAETPEAQNRSYGRLKEKFVAVARGTKSVLLSRYNGEKVIQLPRLRIRSNPHVERRSELKLRPLRSLDTPFATSIWDMEAVWVTKYSTESAVVMRLGPNGVVPSPHYDFDLYSHCVGWRMTLGMDLLLAFWSPDEQVKVA